LLFGVPTAVETAVIVNDALDLFIGKLQDEAKSNEYMNKLKEDDNYEIIKEALNPQNYNLIVTPKEIDELVDDLSLILADGINIAL
jgi:spore protease